MELANPKNLASLNWKVSLRCNGGACVQVADDGDMIFLGDTKNQAGTVFSCSRPQWQAFITQIKSGDLDLS